MELAWRACVHGWSQGKRIGGFVVESSWSAAACTARGMAQPIRGSQQHPEPLPGVSPPQPLPWQKGSQQGMVLGKPLMPAHRTSPRDCRLFWCSSGPQFPQPQNGKDDAISASERKSCRKSKNRSCHQHCWPWGRMGMGAEHGERVPTGRERQAWAWQQLMGVYESGQTVGHGLPLPMAIRQCP